MKIFTPMLAICLCLPLAIAPFASFADGHKSEETYKKSRQKKKRPYSPPGMTPLFRGIELSDEQEVRIKKIVAEQHKNRAQSNKNQRVSHSATLKQLQAHLLADNFDEVKVRELATLLAQSQVENRVSRMRRQHEIFNILTAKQKEQVKSNMNNIEHKMKPRDNKKP